MDCLISGTNEEGLGNKIEQLDVKGVFQSLGLQLSHGSALAWGLGLPPGQETLL